MGVFEKLPYLNYHDINLDWLVRQTKKNASDNTYLMKIFKWFQDQGLVGTVTDVTENPDDTVKIDYADFENNTTDNFTVYNKNGVDGLVSGALSDAETYADTGIANAFKGLGDLPAETDLQNTDLLLINRSGVAKAIAGDVVAKQSDMTTVQGNITNLQTNKADKTEIAYSSVSFAISDVNATYMSSIYESYAQKFGRVCRLQLIGQTTSNVAANTNCVVMTLPTGYRPVSQVRTTAPQWSVNWNSPGAIGSTDLFVTIATSGTVTINLGSNTKLAGFVLDVTFLTA